MKKSFYASKKWIYVFAAVILVSVGFGLWYRHWYYGRYGHGKDDACVQETLATYTANVEQFEKNLRERYTQQNKLNPEANPPKFPPIPKIPMGLPPGSFIFLSWIENLIRDLECTAMPMPVQDQTIVAYPSPTMQPLPHPCEKNPIVYDPGLLPKQKAIEDLAKSVGRLEIRNQTDVTVPPVMLGSGFLIARSTFAVSCHVIAPLLKLYPDLQLEYPEKLVVDFETTRYSLDPTKEFSVTGFLGCSKKDGLDVALLDFCYRSDPSKPDLECKTPPAKQPAPLPLLLSRPEEMDEIKNEFSTVLGYADFDHFIDPVKRAIYAPWANSYKAASINKTDPSLKKDSRKDEYYYDYGKFLLIDGVEGEDECDQDLGILLDTVSTTVGESGSVVIDLHEPALPKKDALRENGWVDTDPRKPVVVGMHTCCSAYFEKDYGKPPHADLPCSQLRRTFHNQDISSWSILKDRTLCPILRDRGVIVKDIKDHPVNLACHRWW